MSESLCGIFMGRTIFVAGTDTGVGKTLVTAAILRWAIMQGHSPGVLKPLQSGAGWIDRGEYYSDGHVLEMACAGKYRLEEIAPWRFSQELAPALVIEQRGLALTLDDLLLPYERMARGNECVLVEGVGGVAVPLFYDVHTIDLIKVLKAEVLIVARLGLGTINHTILTVEFLKSHGLSPLGVVFSDTSCSFDESKSDNPRLVAHYGGVEVLGVVPWLDQLVGGQMPSLEVLDVLGGYIDCERIFGIEVS